MIKPIPGFPDYFADEDGNIYSKKNGKMKILKQHSRNGIHKNVVIYKMKKPYNLLVHRIILETFIGKCPKGMVGCHGIKGVSDNSVSNLSWKTQKENMRDKYRDGTQQTGENNSWHKLNELQVRIIRKTYTHKKNKFSRKFCYDGTVTYQYLADIFNVNWNTIEAIVNHRNWSFIKE